MRCPPFLSSVRNIRATLTRRIGSTPNAGEGLGLIVSHILGIDRAVAWINITAAWSLIKAPFAAFFIVTYLSVDQQGLWYTFTNLAALSVFAELGFSLIVSQFISHEYSRLSFAHGQLRGEQYYVDRLVSLARYAIKFYAGVTLIAIAALSTVGCFYFRGQLASVLAAWVVFSITGGLNLFVGLLQAIYRGLDRVAETQKAILASAIASTVSTWFALYRGFLIWALPIGSTAGALVLLWCVIRLAPGFWRQLYQYCPAPKISWAREIIWLQGKYAVTFASGYFIFNLVVPAVYKVEGAVAAGQLGLTMAIVAAMQGVATAAVSANVPKLNMLIATNRRDESYRLMLKIIVSSVTLYSLGALLLVGGVLILDSVGLYRDRILALPLLGVVLSYQLAPTLTSGASAYLRAHKEEPHLRLAVVQGFLVATAIFTVLPRFGLFWLLVVFNVVFWLIPVPWIFRMVANYRRRYEPAVVTTSSGSRRSWVG